MARQTEAAPTERRARPRNKPGAPRQRQAYRRALKDRGAETRARLIDAALDVFGHQGFEGATTRQIAHAADANLAAILYHFGSKEALYRAVAGHIVESVSPRIGPLLAMADSALVSIDAAGARRMIGRMLEGFVDVLLASPEAERWARFVVREQLDPTPAYDVIYGLVGPAHTTLTRLVAAALGGDPESPEMKLRAFTILGQGLIFRIAPTLVSRRLGKRSLGANEREAIKRILTSQVNAILTMGGSHA